MHFLQVIKERGLPAVLLLFFTIGFGLKVKAVDWYVLYMKNGTMLTCESYRHLANGDYRIRVNGGDHKDISEDQVFATGMIHPYAIPGYQFDYKYDTISKTYVELPNHFVHEHGFFFQWQLSIIMIDGMRIIMGYRFNTYVALGLGVGAEYGATISKADNYAPPAPNMAPSYVYNSGYSPFYLYLTGDILKTKATPFYSVELGYNLPWYPHLQTNAEDGRIPPPYSYYTNYGGPTAGLGFGCRIYSRRHGNVSISLNMNIGGLSIKTNGFEGYSNNNYPGNPIYVTSTSNYTMLQPSLRLSAGF